MTILSISVVSVWLLGAFPASQNLQSPVNTKLIDLSGSLLLAVKSNESPDQVIHSLQAFSSTTLISGLPNDAARKTFWINIYNACFQRLAKRGLKNPAIFKAEAIRFADVAFTLDEIEHGILRKYRWKYSLGYWPQFWPSKAIKQLAVDTIDFRIHFALNCGAKSCPPIGFYKYANINKQLDLATRSFLETETVVDDEKKIVRVTKIMQWFKGDFGGRKGIKQIYSAYTSKNISEYTIEYQDYDWTAVLNNYSD